MDWIVQSLRDFLWGFICAIPFVWTGRYVKRLFLCGIAPVGVYWWTLWGHAGLPAAFSYFKVTSGLLIMVLGGLCAAQAKLLWSAWYSRGRECKAADSLRTLSVKAGLLLAMLSSTSAIYLTMSITSGFWWGSYPLIIIVIVFAFMSVVLWSRLSVGGVIWASALGGYLGCLVAEWYENWSLLEPMLVRWRYDYLLDRLVLPECFVFALGGELAAVLLLGLSRIHFVFGLRWRSLARAD